MTDPVYGWGTKDLLAGVRSKRQTFRKSRLANLPHKMSQEKQKQQTSDSTHPDEKIRGQLRRVDLLLFHSASLLIPKSVTVTEAESYLLWR
jgi:hypothetical protein